ncbi:MAG: hypothetical protein ABSD88_03845 [Candidatus Korobacteraceae bacterium]|jgi:CheY-like chemotaxis protein
MALNIQGQNISRVQVIDDDPTARRAMAFTITDANLEALPADGPLPKLREFVKSTKRQVDAVVSDHRLKQGHYATFNGAEAVAELYNAHCPAVLCTRWSTADIDAIRQYIPFIPSLISIDEVNPETIATGFARCISEFKSEPVPSRRAWRTLLRVESVEVGSKPALFYVAIPGWDSKEIIRLPLDLIPYQRRTLLKPGFRFFASVNKGAEQPEALFFTNFEFPVKGKSK